MKNRQVKLATRPCGLVKMSDWNLTEEIIPEPHLGQFLIKVLYLSIDPAMRGWMNDKPSYIPPVKIGEVMRAIGIGRIIASRHQHFAVGEYVMGLLGVQEYTLSEGGHLNKIDPSLAPLPHYLSALGMTGMTAYFGLLDIGQPQPGNTLVVSGAAGAVGILVGQIGKLKGCRVIGITGGVEKCQYITHHLGFDVAIDYKKTDIREQLKKHCPHGIDIYFDNVGGDILDAALSLLNYKARVVLCGAISQYNNENEIIGPKHYLSLLINRAKMEGFIVSDYKDQYPQAAKEMSQWLSTGQIKSKENIVQGQLNLFPPTFQKLFHGENLGKLILALEE